MLPVAAGNAPEGATGVGLLAREDEPVEVLADSVYGTGDTLADLEQAGHTHTIKPWPTRPMTDTPDGFTIETSISTWPPGPPPAQAATP